MQDTEFQLVAAAWLAKFGVPIPIMGAIELAKEILQEGPVLLPSMDLHSPKAEAA